MATVASHDNVSLRCSSSAVVEIPITLIPRLAVRTPFVLLCRLHLLSFRSAVNSKTLTSSCLRHNIVKRVKENTTVRWVTAVPRLL